MKKYKGTLGGRSVQTATAIALENAFKEYFKYNQQCQEWQSRNQARYARRALLKLKRLAHARRQELLMLYSTNEEETNEYYDNIFGGGTAHKEDTNEE